MNDHPVILCVEDDPLSRKLMEMLLCGRMALTHVTLWEDSTNFPERLAALIPKPDVIFLDIHMKPYNGFQTIAMVRQTKAFSQTPVVALTARVMNDEIQQLRIAGFDSCLAKPIDSGNFPEVLQRILKRESAWQIFR